MSDERRRSQRIDAKIDVQFRSGQEFTKCYTENLSKGGILIETDILPDPNAMVEIVLELPEVITEMEGRRVVLRGKIVRRMTFSIDSKTIHKVAIQFVDVSAGLQAQLDHIYERLSSLSASTADQA